MPLWILLSILIPPALGDEPPRVVAVGDLHGDLDNAIGALALTGVVDSSGKWIGGKATLVQTGDTTDRGPDSGAIVDLMMRLESEARAAGGQVIALLGNHEVMNLHGRLDYVHPGDFAAYGGPQARAEAYGPEGRHGRWLVDQPITARVGETVFAHGGVTEAWAAKGVDTLNTEARAAIVAGGGAILGSDGPLWYRGYVQDDEASACPKLARALNSLDARRMVVGHTTRRDGRVETRCGGALVVIDIGISDHYGGHLGAIEIVGGDARALYPSGAIDLEDPKP